MTLVRFQYCPGLIWLWEICFHHGLCFFSVEKSKDDRPKKKENEDYPEKKDNQDSLQKKEDQDYDPAEPTEDEASEYFG